MFVLFSCYGDHRDLHVLTHSFPTRRSSDLRIWRGWRHTQSTCSSKSKSTRCPAARNPLILKESSASSVTRVIRDMSHRSEEHTSELQSLMRISYAVFCLKKKNKTQT